MQLILFVLILIFNFVLSLSQNPNNVTSNPLTVGIAKPRSLTDFSSVLYEMLTSSAESIESDSGSNGINKTKDGGKVDAMEILKGQEQAQNPYIQARGQPNRFNGNVGPTNNFGTPLGAYNPQGFSRPRNPAYGNQFQNHNNYNNNNNNRGFGQLSDILQGVIPNSPQRGFDPRTPQLQQPVSNYPNNYPNLNLNHGNGRNVNIPNQGFGLGDQASNENNDQSGETELPQPNLGEQGDEGADNAEGPVNDEGLNEEIQPNEEEPIEGNNNEEGLYDNGSNEGGDEVDERADEDGEQPENDEDKIASTNNNDEANADEVADADESTGQEGEQEQDPSNDPDLAQFQNFQGGNFPGDLFPPGILSQGDLQDIQKSIEEQQKNDAEKQKAEEEAAAQSENDNGNEENEETEDEEEPEKPVESPPISNQLAPGYGGRGVNRQPNLLGLNRGLTGRSRNPGLIQPYELNNAAYGNRGGLVNNNRYGSNNRGDFGTGIQDYEYERPKINRGSNVADRASLGLRGNLPFNRNRFHPSHESNEDEEDSEDQTPLNLRNRLANRFGRFRPRLFGPSGRYNEDLGEYGGRRANSNQLLDIRPGSTPANSHDNVVDKRKLSLKQLFKLKDSQSEVDYDDED